MLRLTGLVLTGLLALGLATAPAAGAVDGPPTSVQLTVPGTGQVQTLSYSDRDYEVLALLVGARETRPSVETARPGVDSFRTVGLTLTWLHHHDEPWRVDRVFLTRDEGVWIATRLAGGEGSVRAGLQRWSRPDAPDRLISLLEHLGVAQAARGHGGFPDKPGRFAAGFVRPAVVEAGEDPPPGRPSTTSGSGQWALIAVALGIAALAAGSRLRDRLAGTGPAADDVQDRTGGPPPEAEQLTWGPGPRR